MSAFPIVATPALWRRAFRTLMVGTCLALAACGGGPESTAEAWLDALNRGAIEEALELSTEETKALLSIGRSLGEDLSVGEYEIVRVNEISGDRAEVVVSAMDEESTLDLRKIDGEWKVGFKK